MPNIATALKEEIRRLARKEIKAMVGSTRRAVVQYRRDIAKLKRQLSHQEKNVAKLEKQLIAQGGKRKTDGEEPPSSARFSPRSLKAQRRRLKLSAADYGKLVGVSGLTVYNWESGKSRPRKAQLASVVAIRGIGKREAAKRLEALGK